MEKFIVVGDGLAAQNTLFYLMKSILHSHLAKKSLPVSILQLSSRHLAPPCTLNSTSLCAVRGAKQGTPRGESLVAGFQEAWQFYHQWSPRGVYLGHVSSICPLHHQHEEDYRRRFGEEIRQVKTLPFLSRPLAHDVLAVTEKALFFDPLLYQGWIRDQLVEMSSHSQGQVTFQSKEAFVRRVEIHEGKGEGFTVLWDEYGERYQAEKIIFCTGAYTKIFQSSTPWSSHPQIENSQVQSGSFLEFSEIDLGDKSWAVNLREKKILLYRHQSKKLLLTGAQAPGAQWCPPLGELKKSYEEFHSFLHTAFAFPAWCQGQIKTGLRQKGIKRRPFWGELWPADDGGDCKQMARHYGLFSLYKNGLSYSFLGAIELVDLMVKNQV